MKFLGGRVVLDRNEISGAFGDIGTDLPLLVGMILACGLDPASTLFMFGAAQIATGLLYGVPMPVQPLKAMAALMITQKLRGGLLYGAGLSIGVVMLLLTATGALRRIVAAIPRSAVRGVQFGLGLSLASLALKEYVLPGGRDGWALAACGSALALVLLGNRKYPPALPVVLLGAVFAFFFGGASLPAVFKGFAVKLPAPAAPSSADIQAGFLALALPQLALSLSNSVIATKKTLDDLFPEKGFTAEKIGWTYSLMNLVMPFFGGAPVCHGAGGIAGHYNFGGRTGGSVIIYGAMFAAAGLLFSGSFGELVKFMPKPLLGVILLFEALYLLSFVADIAASKKCLFVALTVAVLSFTLPYGYAIGLAAGVLLDHFVSKEAILAHY